MRMRDARRLLKYWSDAPPAHLAALQIRDVVITACGGTPPTPKSSEPTMTSPEEWTALAVSLGK